MSRGDHQGLSEQTDRGLEAAGFYFLIMFCGAWIWRHKDTGEKVNYTLSEALREVPARNKAEVSPLLRQTRGFDGLAAIREPLSTEKLSLTDRGDEPVIELNPCTAALSTEVK